MRRRHIIIINHNKKFKSLKKYAWQRNFFAEKRKKRRENKKVISEHLHEEGKYIFINLKQKIMSELSNIKIFLFKCGFRNVLNVSSCSLIK